jgi:hypothetical protein
MPKYVYTGHNSNQDGFLVLSDMDWSDFARSRSCTYHRIRGENVLVSFDSNYSIRELQEQIGDNDVGYGVFTVYRSKCKMDENLAGAVCW